MRAANNFEGSYFALAAIIVGTLYSAVFGYVVFASGANQPLFDLGSLITACVPLYLVLQIWFALAWSGRWRIAALLPVIVFVPVLAYTLVALAKGANLWPLVLIFTSPFGVAYLTTVWAGHALVNRRAAA
jgi:hypothetical protein